MAQPRRKSGFNGKAQPFLTTGGEAVPKENLVKKENKKLLVCFADSIRQHSQAKRFSGLRGLTEPVNALESV